MDIAVASASGINSVQAVTGQPVPPRVLTPGDIIDAKVLQILNDGQARLALGGSVIDVAAQAKLIAGSLVRLAVSATDTGIKLTIIDQVVPSVTPQTATPSAPATTVSQSATIATLPTPGSPGSPTPGVPLAPADPATVVVVPGSVSGAPANPAIAAPVAADGLSSDSHAQSPLPSPFQPQPPAPVAAAAVALSTAVQASAARQTGLAPLFADASVAANLASLPEPVRRAAQQLLALRPTLDETVSAATVKQAFQRSGLFLEARLAAEATSGAPPSALPIADLKAAMTVMRAVLGSWMNEEGAPSVAAPATASTMSPSPLPTRPAETQLASLPVQAGSQPPPPPYRGAAPAAQPAVPPSIGSDTAPETVGRALIAEVDGALSRQTLLQAASLPDVSDPSPRQEAPRWNFEVPFALPQGTTVAQFEIARDGHGDAATSAQPVWRVRFSIAIEPIGPVHAQVALIGHRAAVTLWAERPATSMQLRDNSARLAEALRAAEFEASDVMVRDGTPPRPNQPAPSGRFLDRAS